MIYYWFPLRYFGKPQNYWNDNAPEFKYYCVEAGEYSVNNFDSINEMKESIIFGGEILFSYNEKIYGITRLKNDRIILAESDGSNEIVFSSVDNLLKHSIDGNTIKDILKHSDIIMRNI